MKRMVYNRFNGLQIGEFDISPGANLEGTNLSGANLSHTNLSRANLSRSNLEGVDLRDADLRGADLSYANLSGSNLCNVNLSVYFYRADLSSANLEGADLSSVNLSNAELSDANLKNAKLPKFQIPQRKSLIVFKKLKEIRIAKLRIPARAKRTASLVGNKCRAERAIVLEIYDSYDPKIKHQTGRSMHDQNFIYEVGKEVKPTEEYDGDIRVECRPGIHFFMTEEEARKY